MYVQSKKEIKYKEENAFYVLLTYWCLQCSQWFIFVAQYVRADLVDFISRRMYIGRKDAILRSSPSTKAIIDHRPPRRYSSQSSKRKEVPTR